MRFPQDLGKKLLSRASAILVVGLLVLATTRGWQPSLKNPPPLTHSQIDSMARLQKSVRHFSVAIGNRNYRSIASLDRTAEDIAKALRALGYQVEIFPYQTLGMTFKNILATDPLRSPELPRILVSAHYDTCFNPGADDNASGVAGMLELARLVKDQDLPANVQFAAFVNEEPPFFRTEHMGSRVFLKDHKERVKGLSGVITLEMIGYFSDRPFSQEYYPLLGPFYPNRADFITVIGNYASRDLLGRVKKSFQAHRQITVASIIAPEFLPGVTYSDHWSFWREGIPAVMVTDTAFMRNPHYHKLSDLPETLDYERMARVIHGLHKAILDFNSAKINTPNSISTESD
ncbi:MAG: M28 family peptidase [Candidatus Omnitrophota bacterium]|nr:M28 family peptidase [Candidatus Omnitrophota bacterium]MDZ4242285.1 M28 family peptidase [Candidatus Omnitrophota bacterium]